jgi:beta-phosphoglucomutase
MGLATMGDQHNIDFTFETLNLTNFFHSTTGGHEVKKGKPHPEIFLTAAEKIDVNPSDCLAFEDTLSGILSAKAAGMDVIGITTMFDEKTLLKMGCKRIINNYDEIKV